MGFPGGASDKESACNAGDLRDMVPMLGSRRSPRGGYRNPVQYLFLGNPMDRQVWQATVHGVAESQI